MRRTAGELPKATGSPSLRDANGNYSDSETRSPGCPPAQAPGRSGRKRSLSLGMHRVDCCFSPCARYKSRIAGNATAQCSNSVSPERGAGRSGGRGVNARFSRWCRQDLWAARESHYPQGTHGRPPPPAVLPPAKWRDGERRYPKTVDARDDFGATAHPACFHQSGYRQAAASRPSQPRCRLGTTRVPKRRGKGQDEAVNAGEIARNGTALDRKQSASRAPWAGTS